MSSVAAVAARTWAALVHHPVYDHLGDTVTTSITNLDLHDLARSACTYGLAGCFIVTPISAQRDLAGRILANWGPATSDGRRNGHRHRALATVEVAASLEDVELAVSQRAGAAPVRVVTAARRRPSAIGYQALMASLREAEKPLLLLFGTGWGLADGVVDRVEHVLAPIRGYTDYNHLSVRSAAAVVLDRLFGDRSDEAGALEGATES